MPPAACQTPSEEFAEAASARVPGVAEEFCRTENPGGADNPSASRNIANKTALSFIEIGQGMDDLLWLPETPFTPHCRTISL